MHARLSRFAGLPPEKVGETLDEFKEQELPNLEKQSGFRGVTVLVDYSSGKAAAITFWETERDLHNSERAGEQARATAVATAGPAREPVVDRYEVVLHHEVALQN
jgi:heme-degrading monooxygenase HmoA